MSHVRQQIREAVVEAVTGLATTGQRVFTAHPFPLDRLELPGLVVMAPNETIPNGTIGNIRLDRQLAVLIVGYAEGEAVENVLDTMAAEIEQALGTNNRLGGVVKDLALISTEMEVDGDARKRTGEIRLTYQAFYRTGIAAPETAL